MQKNFNAYFWQFDKIVFSVENTCFSWTNFYGILVTKTKERTASTVRSFILFVDRLFCQRICAQIKLVCTAGHLHQDAIAAGTDL